MRGNWNDVWDSFDRRKGAKAANDAVGAEAAVEEADMFLLAGIAAE